MESNASSNETVAKPMATANESRYNNGFIAKLMLMWKREMRAWLPCKHQAGHGSIDTSGLK
jgi:hypothetical protein